MGNVQDLTVVTVAGSTMDDELVGACNAMGSATPTGVPTLNSPSNLHDAMRVATIEDEAPCACLC